MALCVAQKAFCIKISGAFGPWRVWILMAASPKILLAFQESVEHALPNVNGTNRDNKRLQSSN